MGCQQGPGSWESFWGGSWGHSGGSATSMGHLRGASGSDLGLFRVMEGANLRVLIVLRVSAPEPECGRSPQLRLGVCGPLAPAPAPLLCCLWLPLGLHLRHLRRPLLLQPLPGHPPGYPVWQRGRQDSQYGDMGMWGYWDAPEHPVWGCWGYGGHTRTPGTGGQGHGDSPCCCQGTPQDRQYRDTWGGHWDKAWGDTGAPPTPTSPHRCLKWTV